MIETNEEEERITMEIWVWKKNTNGYLWRRRRNRYVVQRSRDGFFFTHSLPMCHCVFEEKNVTSTLTESKSRGSIVLQKWWNLGAKKCILTFDFTWGILYFSRNDPLHALCLSNSLFVSVCGQKKTKYIRVSLLILIYTDYPISSQPSIHFHSKVINKGEKSSKL